MTSISVTIKHSGKTHTLPLDSSQPPLAFKDTIYQSTGVPVNRMKVMNKGLTLTDNDNWPGKLALKEGITFMVVGTAGELPRPPEKKIVFLEGSVVDHCPRPRFGGTESRSALSS
jgi:ubiquitin carboxyl-terminal hydrolase 14